MLNSKINRIPTNIRNRSGMVTIYISFNVVLYIFYEKKTKLLFSDDMFYE